MAPDVGEGLVEGGTYRAFLEGLKPWLARKLKLKQPRCLQEAMKMVKILKDSYYAEKRQGKDGQVGKSSKAPWKGKETLEESTKGKKKELCFNCREK